jgi:hypothetical protein
VVVFLCSTHDVTDLPPGAPTSGARAYINKEHFGADALRELWDNRTTTAFATLLLTAPSSTSPRTPRSAPEPAGLPGPPDRALAGEAATAVTAWASRQIPDLPLIARVRPANLASQRVAIRAGLTRAEHLDTTGYDGLDWIFAANLPD